MPLPMTRNRRNPDFHRSWWDSEYTPAILAGVWGGILWSLMALTASIVWDLDQSWYDTSPAYLLPFRIALFWPVWGTVQAEDALAALGWQVEGAWFLLLPAVSILPLLAVGVLWTYLKGRREA